MPTDHAPQEVIAIVPAAGSATRLAPLPCSKEVFPIGFRRTGDDKSYRPKAVSHYLFDMFRRAGIKKAFVVLSPGKWDIPSYFKDGEIADIHLGYLMVDVPIAVPYSLDQAFPFVGDQLVALGFPDIILKPDDAFVNVLRKHKKSHADVVLGLFPTDKPHKMDMVELGEAGQLLNIDIKPSHTILKYTWLIAVWGPVFTGYLHAFVSNHKKRALVEGASASENPERELFIGDVFSAALKDRLKFDTVMFPDGYSLDIGTPADLARAVEKHISH